MLFALVSKDAPHPLENIKRPKQSIGKGNSAMNFLKRKNRKDKN